MIEKQGGTPHIPIEGIWLDIQTIGVGTLHNTEIQGMLTAHTALERNPRMSKGFKETTKLFKGI